MLILVTLQATLSMLMWSADGVRTYNGVCTYQGYLPIYFVLLRNAEWDTRVSFIFQGSEKAGR